MLNNDLDRLCFIEDAWKTDYASWQWIIIYIIIGVVLVALIILIVMLANRW